MNHAKWKRNVSVLLAMLAVACVAVAIRQMNGYGPVPMIVSMTWFFSGWATAMLSRFWR